MGQEANRRRLLHLAEYLRGQQARKIVGTQVVLKDTRDCTPLKLTIQRIQLSGQKVKVLAHEVRQGMDHFLAEGTSVWFTWGEFY